MKTEIINEASEKGQKAALKKQMDMVRNHGTKFLARQIHSKNTSEEYKKACLEELKRREGIYKMKSMSPEAKAAEEAKLKVEAEAKAAEEAKLKAEAEAEAKAAEEAKLKVEAEAKAESEPKTDGEGQ